MRKIILLAALPLILFSCGKAGKKANEFSNDMENVNVWSNQATIVRGIAHTGNYASKLDSTAVYSFGFQSLFENVLKNIPKKINVTMWIYAPQANPKATLVVDINSNGKSKYWRNSALNGVTDAKEWKKMSATFDLPSNLDIKDELKIYVWNPDKQELYIDDLDISFE